MIKRLRKEEESDELKRRLTQLTEEMRSKYFQQSSTNNSAITTMTKPTSNSNVDHTDHHVTENDKSKSSQAKQTADKYQQLRPTNQHYLSPDSNFVSTPILLSSSVRDTNIGREVNSNSSVAVSQKNESQVEKLRKT